MLNKNRELGFLKKRTVFVMLIVIIAMCSIELGLRIGGYVVLKVRQSVESISAKKDKSKFIILCLGDSYTFGLGTTYQYSYPRQLEGILNERFSGNRFEAYNLGIPGSNSSQLTNNMQGNINKYNPDLLIVMTGRNDAWNLTDVANTTFLNSIGSTLTHLRIYKLGKIILANIKDDSKNRMISKSYVKIGLANDYSKDDKMQSDITPAVSRQIIIGHNFAAQARYDLAEKCFLKVLELDPDNISANRQLGTIYREQAKYESAEECLKKSLVRANGTKDLGVYLELGMIHRLQKKYELAKEELKEAMMDLQHLYLAFNELSQLYKYREDFFNDVENFKKEISNKTVMAKINALLRFKKDEECVYKIIYANLVKIKEISRRNNVKVAFQTYPNYNADVLNKKVREFAKENASLLIDNYLIFQEKLATQDEKDFFVADGHCNAKGYKVIAQDVYRTLLEEGLIDESINSASIN